MSDSEVMTLKPLTEEPELKPTEKEEHRMTEKRKASIAKARETKRLKKEAGEHLLKSLVETKESLEQELKQQTTFWQTKHDTTFEEVERLHRLNKELADKVEHLTSVQTFQPNVKMPELTPAPAGVDRITQPPFSTERKKIVLNRSLR